MKATVDDAAFRASGALWSPSRRSLRRLKRALGLAVWLAGLMVGLSSLEPWIALVGGP